MKIKKINLFTIIGLLTGISSTPSAYSEELNIKVPEVDVTSQKIEKAGYYVPKSKSATRTDSPIKEVPQSIHIVPRELIDDQINITASESLKNVSSVVTNDQFVMPGWESTRIRGFAAEQLIDGFTQYYNTGDRESLVNVQSLEVLKGSNAVLYGGGSGSPVGGIVNIVSKLPNKKASSEIGIKIGSYKFAQPYFDVNQPLNDNALFRITGEYTRADSNTDVVEQKRYNINPAITFTNNETTSLTLQGKFSRWRQQDYQGLPATGTVAGNFKLRRDLFIGDKDLPDSTTNFDGIWATLDHKLNDVWSFNTKARYSESEFDQKAQIFGGNTPDRTDISPSSWGIYNSQLYQRQTEKTVLANATAKFDWGISKNKVLLGADYSKFKDKGFMDLDSAFDSDTLKLTSFSTCPAASIWGFPCSTPVNLANPSFTPYSKPGAGINNNFVTNTTYGAYAQWQSTIADRMHLLASLRQAHVEVDFSGPELDYAATLANLGAYNFTSVYKQANANAEKNKLLPRFGVVVDVTDSISVFANYSQGLRGQPFALFSGTPKPEETRQREVGIKLDAGSLAGQLALYNIERSNVVITDTTSLTGRSLTNGEQRSRGFETDLTWQATPSLKLLGNYAYTDAEFTKNASTTVLSGYQLQGVPKNSARVWANYSFASMGVPGLSTGLGVYWQSEAYIDNANTFKAESYHTVDAAVNYQTARYNVGLTVKNLTNEDYYQFYNYLGGRIAPSIGTTAYLNLAVKF